MKVQEVELEKTTTLEKQALEVIKQIEDLESKQKEILKQKDDKITQLETQLQTESEKIKNSIALLGEEGGENEDDTAISEAQNPFELITDQKSQLEAKDARIAELEKQLEAFQAPKEVKTELTTEQKRALLEEKKKELAEKQAQKEKEASKSELANAHNELQQKLGQVKEKKLSNVNNNGSGVDTSTQIVIERKVSSDDADALADQALDRLKKRASGPILNVNQSQTDKQVELTKEQKEEERLQRILKRSPSLPDVISQSTVNQDDQNQNGLTKEEEKAKNEETRLKRTLSRSKIHTNING